MLFCISGNPGWSEAEPVEEVICSPNRFMINYLTKSEFSSILLKTKRRKKVLIENLLPFSGMAQSDSDVLSLRI